jgi:hypothetical protein
MAKSKRRLSEAERAKRRREDRERPHAATGARSCFLDESGRLR